MRKTSVVATLLAMVALVVVHALPAFSTVSNDASFEAADGNLLANGGTPNFDWNSFSSVTWTGTSPYQQSAKTVSGWAFKGFQDAVVDMTDSAFAGGVKQDDDCGSLNAGKAPNKDDLARTYLASKTISGEVYLAVGWVRIPQNSVSASAHIGYEFNQAGGTSPDCAATLSNNEQLDHLAKRTAGDVLIVYDFEGGAGAIALKLSRWKTSGAKGDCEISSASPPCWSKQVDLTQGGYAEGRTNYSASFISTLDDINPTGTPDPGNAEFGEGIINLTDAGVFTAGQCQTFGRAYAVTRSSGTSSQAAMEDIVGPGAFSLTNCANVNVTKSGSDSGPQTGAVFTLYNGTGTGGTVVGTCTVDATGQCGGSPSFANLQPGPYTLDETTLPTAGGYTKDPTLPYSFTLGSSSLNLSFTNVAQPGRINVSKADDAGNALGGAVFTLTGPSPSTATKTCTTRGPSGSPAGLNSDGSTPATAGTCSFINVAAGTYSLDETTVPTGYEKAAGLPATITVTRGATISAPISGSYIDARYFKIISLVCQSSNNKLYPSAVTIDGVAQGNSESSALLSALVGAWATDQGLTLTTGNKAALEAALCANITTGARDQRKTGSHQADPIGIS